MPNLTLIRHGQSVWNSENRFTGLTDVDLSEVGQAEASAAGAALKAAGAPFDAVFTSTLKRASITAEIVLAETSPLNDHLRSTDGAWIMTRHNDLRERDYGDLTGLNKDEVRDQYGADQYDI